MRSSPSTKITNLDFGDPRQIFGSLCIKDTLTKYCFGEEVEPLSHQNQY